MTAATAVHDKEHGDFLVKEKDHQESVEQMGKATNTVEAEAHDRAQTTFLQQVAKMPAARRSRTLRTSMRRCVPKRNHVPHCDTYLYEAETVPGSPGDGPQLSKTLSLYFIALAG